MLERVYFLIVYLVNYRYSDLYNFTMLKVHTFY